MTPWYDPEIMQSEGAFLLLSVDEKDEPVTKRTKFRRRYLGRIWSNLHEEWHLGGKDRVELTLSLAGFDSWLPLMDPLEYMDALDDLSENVFDALPGLALVSRLAEEYVRGAQGSRMVLRMLDAHFFHKGEQPLMDRNMMWSLEAATPFQRSAIASPLAVDLPYFADLAREADAFLERTCGDWE